MGNEEGTISVPNTGRTGLPAFDESGRKGALERIANERGLKEGDLRIFSEVARELLGAEMVDDISKEGICQEYFDTVQRELLESIAHSTGQKKGDYVSSEVIDELASEIVEDIMSAFVKEVDKTQALDDWLFIDEVELTFDRVVKQVSETITRLREERSRTAINRAISGLDAPIQDLVRSHFKGVGLL